MDARTLGLLIVAAGIALALTGGLVALGAFGWFGRLPGDLRVERDGVRIYIPFVSMLVLSAAFTLLVHLIRRWL